MSKVDFVRPAHFRGQFVFGGRDGDRSDGAGTVVESVGQANVVRHEPCPSIAVHDAAGARIGLMLGHPIDLVRGVVPSGRYDVPAVIGNDIDAFVEEQIHANLSGSYLFILSHGNHRRVYLDAGGSMSAVYDPEAGRVAASTRLLLDDEAYRGRFDSELHAFLEVSREGWFPAGLTAHRGIGRLQANHYLDLDSWEQRRHWPRGPVPEVSDPVDSSRRAGMAVRGTIDALRSSGRVAMALTGGNESRLLLAVCRDIAQELDFVMVDNPNQDVDHVLAEQLAGRFGLKHRFLPSVDASAEEMADYVNRAGHCMGDARARKFPSVYPMAEYGFFLNGVGGGVGRGFFWRKNDTATTRIDARALTTRLGMPVHDRVVQAVDDWLQGTQAVDTLQMLDLAFLELRMAPWAFANAYGVPEVTHVHPLISRPVFETMIGLPPEWRRSGRLTASVVEQFWPELSAVRVNRYGDFRDLVRVARRVWSDPSLVTKKIRRKYA